MRGFDSLKIQKKDYGGKRAGKVKQKKLTFSANISLYYMNSASIYTLELVWQICFSAGCSMGPYPETWMTFSLTHQRKNILSIKVWSPSLLGFEQGVLPPHIPSSLVAGAIKPFKCKNALSIWTTSGNDKESPSPPPSFQPVTFCGQHLGNSFCQCWLHMAAFTYPWDKAEGKAWLLKTEKWRRRSELMRKGKNIQVQGQLAALGGDNYNFLLLSLKVHP